MDTSLKNQNTKKKKNKQKAILKRFASYYRPYYKIFSIDLLCAFVIAALDIIFPLISETFINDLIPNDRIDQILILSGVLVGLYIVKMFCSYYQANVGHLMGTSMETDMRSDLYKHLQNLPPSYFDEHKTGQIMSRLVGDLRETGELAHHGPEDVLISMIMILGTFVFLLRISPILTGLMFIVILIQIIFATRNRLGMARAFKKIRNFHAEINANLENSITGIRLTKSFANEDYEFEKFTVKNTAYNDSWREGYRAMGKFFAGNNFLSDLLSVVNLCGGAILYYYGYINLGELFAFVLYAAMFNKPIRRLIMFTEQFQSGIAGFERFHNLMSLEPDIVDKEDAVELGELKGIIDFENVSFKYVSSPGNIIEKFSVHINQGDKIALVGNSGAGKTTIANLIMRFYEIQSGSVKVDGYDVRDVTMSSLRKNIGYVQQNVFIFWGTIKENIRYGKPNATDEEIIEASKRAKIHEFIMGLPDGYDTFVGERGLKLSGGEKQRVSIARVFLKDPPILILDEATSSLDNVTELQIQRSLVDLSKNRTTIIVAHRLSTIKNVNEILVLEGNKIVERGSHDDLLERNGLYSKLFEAQFKE